MSPEYRTIVRRTSCSEFEAFAAAGEVLELTPEITVVDVEFECDNDPEEGFPIKLNLTVLPHGDLGRLAKRCLPAGCS